MREDTVRHWLWFKSGGRSIINSQSLIDTIYSSVTEETGLQDLVGCLCDPKIDIVAEDLAPHLERAEGLVDVVVPQAKPTSADLKDDINARHQATFAVNARGLIVEANSAAKSIYEILPGHHIRDLPLHSDGSDDLAQLVRSRLQSGAIPNRPNELIRMVATEDNRSVVADISNFPGGDLSERVAIIKTSDIGWPPHLGPIVRDLFNLTRAEGEVLQLVMEGNRVAQIMRRRSASEPTVRKQLASIFAKTGTGSQIECIRTIMGIALIHEREEGHKLAVLKQSESDEIYLPRAEHLHSFLASGGIQLQYSDLGAPDGKPILFEHSHLFGHGWYLDAIQEAKRNGFRIITPIRPGYGGSSVPNREWVTPAEMAKATASLLKHLHLTRISVIAVGLGLVHALALTRHQPGLVRGISSTSPVLPDAVRPSFDGATSICRRALPRGLKLLSKLALSRLSRSGSHAYTQALLSHNPRDLDWVSRPDVLPLLEWSYRMLGGAKSGGLYGDISFAEDWSEWLAETDVPIRFLVGENDRQVPRDDLQALADVHDHICIHVLPDAGALAHLARFGYFVRLARLEFDGAQIPQKYWWPDPKLWARAIKS